MRKSILVTKAKTEKITGTISLELYERIQVVQKKLKSLGNDAVFPVDQIIEDSLLRATRLAETELSIGTKDESLPPPQTN
jgi:hypothetical protein